MFSIRGASSRFVCNACRKGAARSQISPLNGTKPVTSSQARRTRSSPRYLHSTAGLGGGKEVNRQMADDPEYDFLDESKPSSETIEPVQEVQEEAEIIESLDAESLEPDTTERPSEPTRPGRATLPKDESIPWYLQGANAPETAPRPIDIPDLPTNPPPLLKTILEYVAITAGLDDIELLDLRHLDPPPALGPKLIMIIATARSEKHLHVSADRFSRYLRREHGLKANAAGLLGRNELKIKLRRKAKRMRMMANVGGAAQEGNLDDGIRTGWICCTLSKIEAHPEDTHMPGDDVKEFIGFRDVKPGVNVVVQMFTEEKRAETDLETLWGGVLRTHKRESRAVEETLKELEDDIEDLDNEETAEVEQELNRTHPASMSSEGPIETSETPPAQPKRVLPPSTPSDFFPPAPEPDTARRPRRLHTVGLR